MRGARHRRYNRIVEERLIIRIRIVRRATPREHMPHDFGVVLEKLHAPRHVVEEPQRRGAAWLGIGLLIGLGLEMLALGLGLGLGRGRGRGLRPGLGLEMLALPGRA